MNTARAHHTASLLEDGRVLVAGGFNNSGSDLLSAEVYDPATRLFTPTGDFATARRNHTATHLPDGKIMVVGGYHGTGEVMEALSSVEIYDPETGIWNATGSLGTARFSHTATLLPDGNVLVVGGENGGGPLASAEIYDPNEGSWSYTGSMTSPRTGHTATLLREGRVLVVGGEDIHGAQASTELYDQESRNVERNQELYECSARLAYGYPLTQWQSIGRGRAE